MSSYADLSSAEWTQAVEAVRGEVVKSSSLEAAASAAARELSVRFSDKTALARVYAVIPYRELEPKVAAFVDALGGGAIRPETPVLTLLGTHGAKEEWCSRARSAGHRGIPLVSASFVEAIPMVARLLKELGVDLAFLDAATDLNARRLLGGFNGLFFVDDAATARDNAGRLIIPAQDFVEEQSVKSVFGMGGFYPDNTLIVIIVFTREQLKRSHVERLTSLISAFKGETFGVVRGRKIFSS